MRRSSSETIVVFGAEPRQVLRAAQALRPVAGGAGALGQDLPGPAAGALDGKLYAVGGRLGGSYARNLDTVEVYDPARNAWRPAASLPTARSGIAAAVLGGRLHVFGGEAPTGTFSQVEAYDAAASRWVSLTPMPTARHGLAAVSLEGRIHVVSGGPHPGGSFSSVHEVFTP